MTLEMCAQNCAGYNFFGTEYADECYCGYTLSTSLKAPETDCTSYCSGNPSEICGTNNRLSVYQNSVYAPPPPPPTHVPQVGGYTWQGCYTEATAQRALTGPSFAGTMTVEACQAFCTGYSYFGVEYARECEFSPTLMI
jgi:WSC domain